MKEYRFGAKFACKKTHVSRQTIIDIILFVHENHIKKWNTMPGGGRKMVINVNWGGMKKEKRENTKSCWRQTTIITTAICSEPKEGEKLQYVYN